MWRFVIAAMLIGVALIPEHSDTTAGRAFSPPGANVAGARRQFEEFGNQIDPSSERTALEGTTEGIHWKLTVGLSRLGPCLSVVTDDGGRESSCGVSEGDLTAIRTGVAGRIDNTHFRWGDVVVGSAPESKSRVRIRLGSFVRTVTTIDVTTGGSFLRRTLHVFGLAVPRATVDGAAELLDSRGGTIESFPIPATPTSGQP